MSDYHQPGRSGRQVAAIVRAMGPGRYGHTPLVQEAPPAQQAFPTAAQAPPRGEHEQGLPPPASMQQLPPAQMLGRSIPQSRPQAPQLLASRRTSTHWPPQSRNPAGQHGRTQMTGPGQLRPPPRTQTRPIVTHALQVSATTALSLPPQKAAPPRHPAVALVAGRTTGGGVPLRADIPARTDVDGLHGGRWWRWWRDD